MSLHYFAALLGVGFVAFTSTNVDDLLLLLGFFSDPEFQPWQVVSGQILGMTLLIGVSLLGAFAALALSSTWIGLLGIVPLGIGITKLRVRRRRTRIAPRPVDEFDPRPHRSRVNPLAVALVTISDGGDNVATYVPLFSTSGAHAALLLAALFMGLTGVWCAAALFLVRHRTLGDHIRRLGQMLLPWVLIAIGSLILGRLALQFWP